MAEEENTLFVRAGQGRDFWRDRRLDEYDTVLLLLPLEKDLTESLLAALEENLRRMAEKDGQPPRAIVLAAAPARESELYSVSPVSETEADNLLFLYSMYEFSGKLVIGSLDLPWGRKARNLLNGGIALGPDLIRALFF